MDGATIVARVTQRLPHHTTIRLHQSPTTHHLVSALNPEVFGVGMALMDGATIHLMSALNPEEVGIGMAIKDGATTIRRLRQTRTLTGNKENTNVIHPEEVGIGMAVKDGATTIRRLPTQATIGLHRTQGTPQHSPLTASFSKTVKKKEEQ